MIIINHSQHEMRRYLCSEKGKLTKFRLKLFVHTSIFILSCKARNQRLATSKIERLRSE